MAMRAFQVREGGMNQKTFSQLYFQEPSGTQVRRL